MVVLARPMIVLGISALVLTASLLEFDCRPFRPDPADDRVQERPGAIASAIRHLARAFIIMMENKPYAEDLPRPWFDGRNGGDILTLSIDGCFRRAR